MSNRFMSQSRSNQRNSPKPQKIFTAKRDFQNPSSRQTLSDTFRTTVATSTTSGGSDNAASASASRVKLGENGEWVNKSLPNGKFVIYLPQDEAVAAGLGPEEGALDPVESQRVVDLLNRELARLLKLRPKEFWREVAIDESLSAFLESYLKFRSRWYDFPYRGARAIVAGIIVGDFELSQRVFMVLYRLSSNRDPGAKASDTLSPLDHSALLQDKKLLDLSKLMDICAIYGHENEDLTRILVINAMKAQPHIHDEFPALMSHFLSIVQTMYERCSSSLEVLFSSGSHLDEGSNRLLFDYLEVMDFINDSVVSMDSFVNAYKQAAIFFSSPVEMSYGSEELPTILGRLHDSLLPSLQRGFAIIFATVEDKRQEMSSELQSNVFISLKMLSTRIVKFGWKLLYFCYLSDEAFQDSHSLPVSMKMFPANVEDPVVRADILIQSLRNLSGNVAHVPEAKTRETFIMSIEKDHRIMSRIELLQKTGWMSMEDEQFQFLAQITSYQPDSNTKVKTSDSYPASSITTQREEDTAILESKISQIKELFPNYGRGFLVACLEAYNHDAEAVIQRILEGTLHEELQSLDISLETAPKPDSTTVSKYDKGKGKLVESTEAVAPPVVKSHAGVSSGASSSSAGRFVRKNVNDLIDSETLDATKEKELAKTAALISQLEYEDEYDDSFDDLGLSVGDSGLDESESLSDKINSQRGRSTEADGSSSSDNSKWNSIKKPQFYVKDGKNYSYKVDGSVAVANYKEARMLNQAQKELIHGLGRGGNMPFGMVRMQEELNEEQDDEQEDTENVGGRGRGRGRDRGRSQGRGPGSARGRGKRDFPSGSVGRQPESNEGQDGSQETDEVGGEGGRGNSRGGGRRGRGRNQFRRDRALSKHFSGLPGHYKD